VSCGGLFLGLRDTRHHRQLQLRQPGGGGCLGSNYGEKKNSKGPNQLATQKDTIRDIQKLCRLLEIFALFRKGN